MRYKFSTGKRNGWVATLIFVLGMILFFAQQAGYMDETGRLMQRTQPGLYSITSFVDGDTVVVNMNGHDERVRFIGVDTPETHKPNTPVQCYGPAASAYTKRIIGKSPVRLESDSLSTNRDRYDRLLRYVYLPDGTLVNESIIKEGYGFYYPYFPFTKSERFNAAQATAMSQHKGLWGNCHPTKTDRGGYISNNQ